MSEKQNTDGDESQAKDLAVRNSESANYKEKDTEDSKIIAKILKLVDLAGEIPKVNMSGVESAEQQEYLKWHNIDRFEQAIDDEEFKGGNNFKSTLHYILNPDGSLSADLTPINPGDKYPPPKDTFYSLIRTGDPLDESESKMKVQIRTRDGLDGRYHGLFRTAHPGQPQSPLIDQVTLSATKSGDVSAGRMEIEYHMLKDPDLIALHAKTRRIPNERSRKGIMSFDFKGDKVTSSWIDYDVDVEAYRTSFGEVANFKEPTVQPIGSEFFKMLGLGLMTSEAAIKQAKLKAGSVSLEPAVKIIDAESLSPRAALPPPKERFGFIRGALRSLRGKR